MVDEIRAASWSELQECLYEHAWNPALRRYRSNLAFRGEPDAGFDLRSSLGALRDLIESYTPDEELLLKYVAANIEGTYEGDAAYAPGGSKMCVNTENIKRLSDAVAAEIGLTSVPCGERETDLSASYH